MRRDHVPYDLWERQGYLMTTEGNVVHYGFIEKYIERLGERFNIREIAFDRWGAVQMVQNLEGIGYCTVAKHVGLPANTVKTFCRRNNLSSAVLSDGAPSRKPQAGTSVQTSAEQIQMKKESGSYSSKGKSLAECEVTLSFSTNPDMSAVEDVMTALMNSLER